MNRIRTSKIDDSTTLTTRERRLLQLWFGWEVHSELDYSEITRERLSPEIIGQLIDYGFEQGGLDWIVKHRTLLNRFREAQLLTRDESAKTIRVARLLALGECVFDNADKAVNWFSKPKRQLNGLTPKEAMQDEFGARCVEQLLYKIDNGYF